jgi:DNA-binding CsgD family transcriptional regulator
MVIMNSLHTREQDEFRDAEQNGNQYVYLVDNDQEMMLILKKNMDKMNGVHLDDNSSSIQHFITGKIENLLDRMSEKGPLSDREREVLSYAAQGKSNKQIGNLIGLSESTVKNHFSSTLRKLHANDRTHAVIVAVSNGWLNINNISSAIANEAKLTAIEDY